MKFSGQTCIYCLRRLSTRTGDHVIARAFFPKDKRHNLPKVPCCEVCGNEKSRLEHYLATVLPFGARHPDAAAQLNTLVPRRLAENRKLHRELEAGKSRVWTREPSGLLTPTIALTFDTDKLVGLFQYITKGLMWYHWMVPLGADCFVEVHLPTREIEGVLAKLSSLKAKVRVSRDLGDGTFVYKGAQGTNDRISVWDFSIYGGVKLAGGGTAPQEISNVRALTGPRAVADRVERALAARTVISLLGRPV